MIYSPGFTAPDGKTYRNLVPQVYYLTDKVEELLAGGGSEDGSEGSEIYYTSTYIQPSNFSVVDPESLVKTYTYTIPFTQFTNPSFFYISNSSVSLGTLGIYINARENSLVLTTYTNPGLNGFVGFYLSIWAYETSEDSYQMAQELVSPTSLDNINTRYLGTVSIPTTQWSGSGNNYSAQISTSQITGYYANGLTLFIPIAKSKQVIWNLGIYILQHQIIAGTGISLHSPSIPAEELDFYVYSIPIPNQTSATVALL